MGEEETGRPKRILSGIQPSGKLHLGNYFGAMKQQIDLQEEGECFYFIANYHAMTTVQDADRLRKLTRDVALDYLALGLDPERAVLFRQSDVPEVTELTWVLSTVTGKGLMDRGTSYKDKVQKGIAPNLGLYIYPALQAADILIYESDIVPVGEDQLQHIEFARDMAGYFNNTYEEVLRLPESRLAETPKVPGTDGQKMSKSYGNTIDIFDTGKSLKKSVMGIVTDSTPLEAAKDPETCNCFAIYSLFATSEEQEAMAERYRAGGYGYGHAKTALLEKVKETFGEAREKRKELEAHPERVEAILREGGRRARRVAKRTMEKVRDACGLVTDP